MISNGKLFDEGYDSTVFIPEDDRVGILYHVPLKKDEIVTTKNIEAVLGIFQERYHTLPKSIWINESVKETITDKNLPPVEFKGDLTGNYIFLEFPEDIKKTFTRTKSGGWIVMT